MVAILQRFIICIYSKHRCTRRILVAKVRGEDLPSNRNQVKLLHCDPQPVGKRSLMVIDSSFGWAYEFPKRTGNMSKKIRNLAALLVVTAFGIFIIYPVVSLFIPRQGTVTSVSDLPRVFSKAGPQFAAAFTNSLIQKFPFDGPIDWKLSLFKDPMGSLSGRVDTNALHKFVTDNSGTKFRWLGTYTNGEIEDADDWPTKDEYPSVCWKSITFDTPHTNEFTTVIDGTLDIVSNRVHFLIH
jgi:hypothetical protein